MVQLDCAWARPGPRSEHFGGGLEEKSSRPGQSVLFYNTASLHVRAAERTKKQKAPKSVIRLNRAAPDRAGRRSPRGRHSSRLYRPSDYTAGPSPRRGNDFPCPVAGFGSCSYNAVTAASEGGTMIPRHEINALRDAFTSPYKIEIDHTGPLKRWLIFFGLITLVISVSILVGAIH
jgi:hypothetical protein